MRKKIEACSGGVPRKRSNNGFGHVPEGPPGNAQKAIKIIDSGKTDPHDDQENLKIIRDVFEKILEYDRNEMISYIEDALPHYKTRSIRQALNSIATVYKNA